MYTTYSPEQAINHVWRMHLYEINTRGFTYNFKKFISSKEIVIKDTEYNEEKRVNTLSQTCYILLNNGTIEKSKYNYSTKTELSAITMEFRGTVKHYGNIIKIASHIIFIDDIKYHNELKKYWSDKGFRYSRQNYENTQEIVDNFVKNNYKKLLIIH